MNSEWRMENSRFSKWEIADCPGPLAVPDGEEWRKVLPFVASSLRPGQGRSVPDRRFVASLTSALLLVSHFAFAVDKNGVSPLAISKPSGPGSLEGLGDAFQPSLNTGMARYSVNFVVPEGVAGFTPSLALQYDSGQGCGVPGMGWTLDVGSIRRQTDEGQPRYFDQPVGNQPLDRFLGPGGEELIPLANGYYLSKNEGPFTRFRRVDDHWEAHSKNGTRMEYGLSDEARISDPMGKKVYRWWLERQTDVHGNVIEYSYIRPDENARQVYLGEIRYGPGAPPWNHRYSVSLGYEGRPDLWTDYRPGFKVATTRRLQRLEMRYDGELIRAYELGYEADPNQSLLTTITQFGADGVSTLPRTTFAYATFPLGDPAVPIDASGQSIGSVGEPGSVLDSPRTEVIDLNADGLPDLLRTDTVHLAYLNLGVHELGGKQMLLWDGPVAVKTEDEAVLGYGLSDSPVYLADMNGDGTADWVVSGLDGVDCFANTGHVGWSRRRRVTVQKFPPPAPYSAPDGSVLSSDLDFDKKMDVIKAEDGAYSIWMFQPAEGQFTDRILTPGARYKGKFLQFGRAGVQLADMNGDRLTDAVEVSSKSVVFCPSMGFGLFDECTEMFLPAEDPALELDQVRRAKITDINNDGLSDLVVERFSGSDLRFWLHKPDGTFARSRYVTGLPATPNSVTRWADINGNGTVDLVYADSTLPESKINAIDVGVLIAGSAHHNALIGIDNGYGRRTRIVYRSMTEFYLDSVAAGNAWNTTVPFPVPIVSRVVSSIGLDLDGYPDEAPGGDRYVVDFVYRDGYYDPQQEQFRGFAFVKEILRGDERFEGSAAPTWVKRIAFHTGAPDGIDNDGNGQTDEFTPEAGREEEPLKGSELWRETTSLPDDPMDDGGFADAAITFERTENTYDVRILCSATGGALADLLGMGYRAMDPYGRTVRQLIPALTRRTIIERGSGPAKVLETRMDLDPLGNKAFDWNLGDLSNPGDDLYTGNEYGLNEPAWIMDNVTRTFQRDGGPAGPLVSDTRHFYDGDPFLGLPPGTIGNRGLLHRTEALLSFGPVPELSQRSYLVGDPRQPGGAVQVLRQEFDEFGNIVVKLDGNAQLNGSGEPNGAGHERRIDFDPELHRFPIRETIVLGNGLPDLVSEATYHFGFSSVASNTDFNGQVSQFEYDAFGRLIHEFLPGDDPESPTMAYEYALGAPISRITTRKHTRAGDSPDVVTSQFFDGLGRKLGTFEAGGPVMTGVTLYNTRGTVRREYQPFEGGGMVWQLPPQNLPALNHEYDATGRVVRTITAQDENGVTAEITKIYRPLEVEESDGEDNRAGGPHQGTPRTLVRDGLDRLIEVRQIEARSAADSGTFVTRYRYAQPKYLVEIEDANGNIKYMRFDGLGRTIFMNDCDRGPVETSYDAAGNLIETRDAKGQLVRYTLDGANRVLTEDYEDDATPLSLPRSPDVVFHYDAPSGAYPWLANTKGHLAWVADLTGAEFRGYDARGTIEAVIKRADHADGTFRDYTVTSLSDSLTRVYQITYPDGGVVRNSYDARGLLRRTTGFIDEVGYQPDSQRSEVRFANGTLTRFRYDPRLRLTDLETDRSKTILQLFHYDYDQVGNVVAIDDNRGLPPGHAANQSAAFIVDDLYRLQSAQGPAFGTLQFDYDRIGNMVVKNNPGDAADHLGVLQYGGKAGTSGRIGRSPGADVGPHALALAGLDRYLRYDANGNLTRDGDTVKYDYDFRDRLGRVDNGADDVRYLYDYTGRRVIKRVNGVQTSYVTKLTEERGNKLSHYVFAGSSRCARADGRISPPSVVSQRVALQPGWNLISFQVMPGSLTPSGVFADIQDRLIAAATLSNGNYLVYVPGGGGNTLTQLAPNVGYWLLMSEPAELVVEGPVVTAAVMLNPGTSALVASPGLTPRGSAEFDPALDSKPLFGDDFVLWSYEGDSIGWTSWSTRAPDYANSLQSLTPGKGYWIMPAEAAELTPPALPPGERFFYHADYLGSTHLVTDALGQVVSERAYYPYGHTRFESTADSSGPHYQFGGKERDAESGLDYFENRFYNPTLARFLSVDPLFGDAPDGAESEDPAQFLQDPINLNLYAFTNDNPVSRIDPTGTQTVYIINKAKTEITVRTNIVIYGTKASDAVAAKIKTTIESAWNKGFQFHGKTVKFQVTVKYHPGITDAAAQRHAMKRGGPDLVRIDETGRSNVNWRSFWSADGKKITSQSAKGSWFTKFDAADTGDEIARVAAHEYGHELGLFDQYKDIKNAAGKVTESKPNKGWENNIMGDSTSGQVEQRNINMALQGKKFQEE